MNELKSYRVWDAPTRWFHWINALSVIGLMAVGVAIMKADVLGIGNPGKIVLKTVHVWIGYVFVANLGWRIVWAFLGNRYARWRQILPGGPGYLRALRSYVAAFAAGHPQHYLGHNPLGRIGATVLFLLILVQAVSGLVLAGTDLFYPPLGQAFAQSVAAPGVDPSTLAPYSPQMYDPKAYAELRALRAPFIETHELTFFALLIASVLHVVAVVVTELREGGSLVSAMLTGRKIIPGKPVDE
jgi:Ni/Fe-hydrogenase 1 B-type cytochrome subunit